MINYKKTSWAATVFCTVCWAYAIVARFTPFFMASRSEKITILGTAMVVIGLLSIFIFHDLLLKIFIKIQSAVSRAFGISISQFFAVE